MSAILGGSVGNFFAVPKSTDPPSPQAPQSSFRWATVTDDSPLTIRMDGEDQALPMVPECLVHASHLAVNSRVWVQQYGQRVIIVGVTLGGEMAAGGDLSGTYPNPSVVSTAGDLSLGGDLVTNGHHIVGTGIPWVMAGGANSFTPVAGPAGMNFNITFPASRFNITPCIVTSINSNGYMGSSVGGLTSSGFNARCWSEAATPSGATFHWLAFQFSSSLAAG